MASTTSENKFSRPEWWTNLQKRMLKTANKYGRRTANILSWLPIGSLLLSAAYVALAEYVTRWEIPLDRENILRGNLVILYVGLVALFGVVGFYRMSGLASNLFVPLALIFMSDLEKNGQIIDGIFNDAGSDIAVIDGKIYAIAGGIYLAFSLLLRLIGPIAARTGRLKGKLKIGLYDHKPWIMAYIPMVVFFGSALLTLPQQLGASWTLVSEQVTFWFAWCAVAYFFLAVFENFGLWPFVIFWICIGFFLGLPLTIDYFKGGNILDAFFAFVGQSAPSINASGCFFFGILFLILVIWSTSWSRLQRFAVITPQEIKTIQAGQKGTTNDLFGLTTEEQKFDYFEVNAGGFGSYIVKTRTGVILVNLKRVYGLYRQWWRPWQPGKLERIEALVGGANVTTTTQTKEDLMRKLDAVEGGVEDGESLDGDSAGDRGDDVGGSSELDAQTTAPRSEDEIQ